MAGKIKSGWDTLEISKDPPYGIMISIDQPSDDRYGYMNIPNNKIKEFKQLLMDTIITLDELDTNEFDDDYNHNDEDHEE